MESYALGCVIGKRMGVGRRPPPCHWDFVRRRPVKVDEQAPTSQLRTMSPTRSTKIKGVLRLRIWLPLHSIGRCMTVD